MPYVGRRSELQQALTALRAGVGVIVTGTIGSGRTRFMREVADRLGDQVPSNLWVGHDVHQLDEAQLVRFGRAVRAGEIVPLASALAGLRLPETIEHLRSEGLLVEITFQALAARELLTIAELRLGGPLDAGSIPVFIPARGGDHVAGLSEALAVATRAGALTDTDGVWTFTGPVPKNDALRSLVFSRSTGQDVRLLHPHAETILDVLSLAPGLTLTAATEILERLDVPRVSAERELEALEEAGMVDVTVLSHPQLHIRDGVDELITTLAIAVLRRWRIASAITATLSAKSADTLTEGELVAVAQHSLDLGLSLPAATLTRAARASLRTPSALQSYRIATAAVDARGGFDAEIVLAAAEVQAGFSEQALARLTRLAAEAGDDEQRAEALQALSRHARESTRQAAELIPGEVLGQLALSDARRDILRGLQLYNLGRPFEAAALITAALPELAGVERAEAYFHVGATELMLGHVARASDAFDEAEAAYTAEGADATHVHMVRASLNVLRGRAAESLPVLLAIREAAGAFGQPVAQALCGWGIGTLLMHCGRVEDAVAEFESAIAVLKSAGVDRTLARVQADLAAALAQAGDAEGARAALPVTSDSDDGAEPAVSGQILLIEGWILAASGDLEHARERMIQAADTYAGGGFLFSSFAALIDAGRVGPAHDLLERIEQLGADMDCDYVDMTLSLARATAAREVSDASDRTELEETRSLAAEFDSVGSAAAVSGHQFIAAEAYDRAATLHLRAGDKRHAAASGRLRDERIAFVGLKSMPLIAAAPAKELSSRELELARLAASGMPNREIAARLVLSVRTVETHLQTVYRKLGVRGRADLRDVL
ncbi:helix-turn-helix transcriptional regulator [Herbiconiux daphne]|uniref:LuxR C-terminal-related transcriptional regulator n=1 Tax=Herbiconiux daphne TaxID=2970914 RepID=A0ABT2H652_9MICO|nr:LuxR family transcriptional regulator [Herbiconiux daphne]MCS5735426.1 LuxR C-terminal-related transcriptional regulator [Herbiconiux daphne]